MTETERLVAKRAAETAMRRWERGVKELQPRERSTYEQGLVEAGDEMRERLLSWVAAERAARVEMELRGD